MKRLVAVVLVVGVAAGLVWRFAAHAENERRAQPSTAPQAVRFVYPVNGPEKVVVTLPGTVLPRQQVTLYARTNGFLQKWNADLGEPVKKGQVLAKLEAPELAVQLAQARTRLAQAERTLVLVQQQHVRTEALSKSGTLAQADLDASALRLSSAQGELATAKDEVVRLSTLVGYLTVEAPFDGTITRRMAESGQLVSAERTALFELASTSDLVVEIEVPQWAAGGVSVGVVGRVETREGKSAPVVVERTAGELDPSLRILRVRLAPTAPLAVTPGAYARVRLELPRTEVPLQLPGSTLTVRGGSPQVATVGADGALHYVPVTMVRDLGRDIEVRGELTPETKVVTYPPAGLGEGDKVAATELKQEQKPPAAPAGPPKSETKLEAKP
ncbi:MAG: efflux RND transporter periplasmic adaptor subunit [Myxococcaceae bacterium]|nr:efflux RND transporter periplasmic adaptor subunit [Myxococcaceae bacterium]